MNIKEEKKIEKNNIRQYAVRLETSDGVGTGFIYAPKEHEYIYVFTVFHVIYTWLEDSKLVLNYQENQIDCLYGEVDICIVDSFSNLKQRIGLGDEEYKGVKEDVAVLKIPKTYFKKETVFPENFLCMPEDSIKTDLDFVGYGYPDKKTIEVELSGKFQRWKKKESMLFCQAENINYPSFSEAMRGYSGTGLFAEYEGNLVLLGITVSCALHEMHKIFSAVGTSQIIEKMHQKGWHTPKIYTDELIQGNKKEVPKDFFDEHIFEWQEECMECFETELIEEIKKMIYQINKNRTPVELSQKESFFDIPICNKENRDECYCYWGGYLWMLLIQNTLYGNIDGKSFILDDGKELGMEFICSEGNGKASLATVVASAIKNRILGEQIPGDSILLWQSNQNPKILVFSKSKFKNIVEDITSGTIKGVDKNCSREGYDLLYGEMKEKNYGIIHINELLNRIVQSRCKTIEELKAVIKEALNDIWK